MAESIKRCAIYTRKSSEEGLEQDFNSLHAQREACEAFIVSQRGEGWRLVSTAYDDGGISGGTMERPALRRLLVDVKEGRIDVIVVYKVDRLTRSLADFAKMVEVFDKAAVSFVAVTQQFNTTSSMGRLTLNVLLSFAQFEREVTGERIRDKIAASKRKGIWMGGNVPLGYDVIDRKLVVVPEEAESVKTIFKRYLQISGVRELKDDLEQLGIRPKARPGKPPGDFWKGALYCILSNPIYIGMIRHKGEHHPGLQEAIIDQETWDAVQDKLKVHTVRMNPNRKTAPSPLIGKILDEQGRALTPSHNSKPGRRYRYYISRTGESASVNDWRLPAIEIEARVEEIARDVLADQSRIVNAGLAAGVPESEIQALLDCSRGKDHPQERTQKEIFRQVQSVQLGGSELKVKVKLDHRIPVTLERSVPVLMRRRGVERRIIIGGPQTKPMAKPNASLIHAVGRGLKWWRQLASGEAKSIADIAHSEQVTARYVSRLIPLGLLAPDIVDAIASGSQPIELTTETLTRSELPSCWKDQREMLGFA